MKKITCCFSILLLGILCGCSNKNGTEESLNNNNENNKDSVIISDSHLGIKMTKVGGVYQIPCVVNGVKMNFIFDTGASNVCISMTEAMFLAKNGYLDDEDYIGFTKSQIADGSVVENMEINLHSIEIEGIMLTDVKAIVVSSIDAPLLLGQSALQKLGRIEIDGDSLFIIKKGDKRKVVKNNAKGQRRSSSSTSMLDPQEHFYDKILAKLGYDGKIEEYLNAAWAAYENNLPENAQRYCDKSLELRKTAKAYGLKGHYYYKEFKDRYDGSYNVGVGGVELKIEDRNKQDFGFYSMRGTYMSSIALSAGVNLEKYYELNRHKQNLGFASGDTLYYDMLVCELASTVGHPVRMIELGQELYLRNPNNTDAMSILGAAYTKQGKYDIAEKWANNILDTHLDDALAYFRLAHIAIAQGRCSEAIRYYEKCLEIDNNDKMALNNMASIYWDMSLYDDGNMRYGEKWDTMRSYAIFLWQKAARLGNPYSKRLLKERGYEW